MRRADGRVGVVDARCCAAPRRRRAARSGARARGRSAVAAALPLRAEAVARIVSTSSGTAGCRRPARGSTRSRRRAGSPGRPCAGPGPPNARLEMFRSTLPAARSRCGRPSVARAGTRPRTTARAPGRHPRARPARAVGRDAQHAVADDARDPHVAVGVEREAVGIRAVAERRERPRAPTARRPARRGTATAGARTSRSRRATRRPARASPRWCSPARRRRCARRARRRER